MSMEKWFSGFPYTEKTKHLYREYMAMFCDILKTTPDDLAIKTPEQVVEIQATLANAMKKMGLSEYTVHLRIHALRSFWRYNGVELPEDIFNYKDCVWLKRERKQQ
ncbi:MAG: hypothetical protein ABSG57_04255 [Candidatus Bathyarchaeia archaeon]